MTIVNTITFHFLNVVIRDIICIAFFFVFKISFEYPFSILRDRKRRYKKIIILDGKNINAYKKSIECSITTLWI